MPQDKDDADLFLETLDWIISKLDEADIPYMITGGSAVGFWGHIRTTMDIDVVIDITRDQVPAFVQSIEQDAYIESSAVHEALAHGTMFNVISNATFFKVDLVPLRNEPYEQKKFNRRIPMEYRDRKIYVISPEDLIISKLLWSKSMGTSERQIRDCSSIYELNRDDLDLTYIEKWINTLNLDEEFSKLDM